jgi:putative ABC transport system substrate-binding protein
VSGASPVGYEQAFAEIKNTRADALLVLPDPLLERGEVTLFALTARLPAMFTFEGPVVTAGGLIAYGPNVVELHRRAAAYVVKILKGARAGDLPVEQPTTFQLVINLRAAKALGLSIPPSLLLRADRVIE